MSKWYGNLDNRLEEGRTVPEITEGMDITMYYWSDRTCYYVTKVHDQKRIEVKKWQVCADHDKKGGMGHQNWLYFKTRKEMNEYLERFFPGQDRYDREDQAETWVYRYNKWMKEYVYTSDRDCATDREHQHLLKHGWFARYYDLSGKISFGRRDYYYDWEF